MRWAILWTLILALVLVPFLLFERTFTEFGTWLSEGGARGWALAATVASLLALDVFLPVPSSLVSTAAGALLGFWQSAAVIWIGMSAGAAIGYAFGASAAPAARRLVGEDGLQRASQALSRHGVWALALCRPVPVLAEASVVFSGLARAPMPQFLAVTTLANLGIALAYASVGAYAMQLQSFLLAFFGAMILPGLTLLLGRRWLARR